VLHISQTTEPDGGAPDVFPQNYTFYPPFFIIIISGLGKKTYSKLALYVIWFYTKLLTM
jgi:hypothetical protein